MLENLHVLMSYEGQNKKIVFRSNATETNHLIAAGKKAVANAIRENRALGLSFVMTKNNKTIRENPDGTTEILSNKPLKSSLKFKKGAILYVKS